MPVINNILTQARLYMPEENIRLIKKAYDYAVKTYADNPARLSGKPYITHPLAVAHILVSLRLDAPTIISGLLHKALRGTPPRSSEAELRDLFGPEVASIVHGATKIDDIQFKSRLDYKAENVKKMLLAISADIRVLLVKLADHLHDIQTLEYVPAARQQELARDSMDLYAPLASRLGLDLVKRELEDAAFRYLYPEQYAELNEKIQMSLPEREKFVEEIKSILTRKISAQGIKNFRVLGRPKHLYSIYRKLVVQNISVDKVYDKVAFRVIVQEVGECYEVLGIVHSLWQPVASRFKDFISSPKANLYQSLHTSVIGPHGDFMEIQIRTEKMDEIANDGIAAHWAYKEGAAISQKDAHMFQWLKQLVQSLQEVDDAREFLDTVRDELDYSTVYALTPNGDVKELPSGSSPLDFAYSIHTDVGHHCVGAKIDGRIVPLKYTIQNGDVIEIITSPHQHPNQGWLALSKTSRARSRIRHWLKQEEKNRFLEDGRDICERELRRHNLSIKRLIKTGHLQNLLKKFNSHHLDDLLRRVGSGEITVAQLTGAFEPSELKAEKTDITELTECLPVGARKKAKSRQGGDSSLVKIDGIDNMMTKISNCCMPMPGDEIVGFITSGRGVSVHKAGCRNFLATDPQRHVAVEWAAESHQALKSRIQIMAHNSKGLLVNLCNVINNSDGAQIMDVEAHTSKNTGQAHIGIVVNVSGRRQLNAILQQIRQMEDVLEAERG